MNWRPAKGLRRLILSPKAMTHPFPPLQKCPWSPFHFPSPPSFARKHHRPIPFIAHQSAPPFPFWLLLSSFGTVLVGGRGEGNNGNENSLFCWLLGASPVNESTEGGEANLPGHSTERREMDGWDEIGGLSPKRDSFIQGRKGDKTIIACAPITSILPQMRIPLQIYLTILRRFHHICNFFFPSTLFRQWNLNPSLRDSESESFISSINIYQHKFVIIFLLIPPIHSPLLFLHLLIGFIRSSLNWGPVGSNRFPTLPFLPLLRQIIPCAPPPPTTSISSNSPSQSTQNVVLRGHGRLLRFFFIAFPPIPLFMCNLENVGGGKRLTKIGWVVCRPHSVSFLVFSFLPYIPLHHPFLPFLVSKMGKVKKGCWGG